LKRPNNEAGKQIRKVFTITIAAAITLSLTGCDALISSTAATGSYEAGKLFANAIPKDQLEALNITDPTAFCDEYATIAEGASTIEGFSAEEFTKGCNDVFSAK
jgi:hypothetical protein